MRRKFGQDECRRIHERLEKMSRNPKKAEEEIRVYLEKSLGLEPNSFEITVRPNKNVKDDFLEDLDLIGDEKLREKVETSLDRIPISEYKKEEIRNMSIDEIREMLKDEFHAIEKYDKRGCVNVHIRLNPSLGINIETAEELVCKAEELFDEYLLGEVRTTKRRKCKADKKIYRIKECPYDELSKKEFKNINIENIEELEHLKDDHLFRLIRKLIAEDKYLAVYFGSNTSPLIYESEGGYEVLAERTGVPLDMGSIKKAPFNFKIKMYKKEPFVYHTEEEQKFTIISTPSKKCIACELTEECAMSSLYHDIIKE